MNVHGIRRRLTLGAALTLFAVYALILTPGRGHNADRLRSDYIAYVKSYEGTPYHNDPAHPPGINCVHLVAYSLMKANLKQGLRTLNPRLIRRAVRLYWTRPVLLPASFREENSDGMTREAFSGYSADCMTSDLLEPGDIGVMAGGHMLTYLGQGEWMEACAAAGKARRIKTATPDHGCLSGIMYVVRWTQFGEQ